MGGHGILYWGCVMAATTVLTWDPGPRRLQGMFTGTYSKNYGSLLAVSYNKEYAAFVIGFVGAT